MNSNQILERFSKVKKLSGAGRYSACCPYHDDRFPSMSIRIMDGRILLHCFAGCNTDEILSAIGLSFNDLFLSDVTTNANRTNRKRAVEQAEQQRRAKEEAEQTAKWLKKSYLAKQLWAVARPITTQSEHSYLIEKDSQPYGLRVLDGWRTGFYDEAGHYVAVSVQNALLIPIYNSLHELQSLQAIFPCAVPGLNRNKDFLAGAKRQGCFYWVGKPTDTACVAEGYSTAWSIHQETGLRVYISFTAGNLQAVAEIVRRNKPKSEIIICGDADLNNVGQAAARRAALAVGGLLSLPPVAQDVKADWNDYLTGSVKHG